MINWVRQEGTGFRKSDSLSGQVGVRKCELPQSPNEGRVFEYVINRDGVGFKKLDQSGLPNGGGGGGGVSET